MSDGTRNAASTSGSSTMARNDDSAAPMTPASTSRATARTGACWPKPVAATASATAIATENSAV